jgi:hypothetical protein
MKGCSGKLHYRSDDGFSSNSTFSSARLKRHSLDKVDPKQCWVDMADEMARIAELFEFGDELEAAVKDARQRVRDWRVANSK